MYSCTLEGSRQPQQNRSLGPQQEWDTPSVQALTPNSAAANQPTGPRKPRAAKLPSLRSPALLLGLWDPRTFPKRIAKRQP